MTHSDRPGNKGMDTWNGRIATENGHPTAPLPDPPLDCGRIKGKFLDLSAPGCWESNHHPTTLLGH